MSLLPRPAHWFEAIVPSDQLLPLLEQLGKTGQVQLEEPDNGWERVSLEALRNSLSAYHNASKEYGVFWPEPEFLQASDEPPQTAAQRALNNLQNWIHENQSLINALRHVQDRMNTARYWQTVINQLRSQGLEISSLGSGSLRPLLCCGEQAELEYEGALVMSLEMENNHCHLAVVHPDAQEDFEHYCRNNSLDVQELPEWFHQCEDIEHQLATLQQEENALEEQLENRNKRLGLETTLGELQQLDWLTSNLGEVSVTPNLVRVTGWSNLDDEQGLQQQLSNSGLIALLRYTQAPEGHHPPTLLRHHHWVKPFEVFVEAIGMPGAKQIDPSDILAVAVPLMFGYMFGDVGQGLVLAGLGWWLQKRWPAARLLIWAGLSATFFGFFFGSVFSIEHAIPPLWQTALTSPLDTLAIPMVLGAALLSLGLGLNALQNIWSRQHRFAGLSDIAILITYWGILLVFLMPQAKWLLFSGLGLWVIALLLTPGFLKELPAELGELIEGLFQLTLNTLSFVRVGAFALAHEGLSTAIVSLAHLGDSTVVFIIVMILGNILIIAIEGLIVSIQVTRLVLFEFFVRFFKSGGRRFEPMAPPPSLQKGEYRANNS